MTNRELISELTHIAPVRENEPLARHTTFGIGGPADIYVVATTTDALRRLAAVTHSYNAPLFVLGSGSNILVGDAGIRGVIIENNTREIEGPYPVNGSSLLRLSAASGISFASLARRLCRSGIAGLEWASGIPGTLGGAVVYNAGAYGGCLADVLCSICIADEHGEEQQLPAAALGLSYRNSIFSRGILRDRVILSLEMYLYPGEASALMQRVAELDRRRTSAQPPGRNAGSIFKNHPEHPAWWLIDQVGLRGYRIGDAQISPQHTNFFVNVGHARAADVKALIDLARQRVYEQFGIQLETEVTMVGEGF